MAIATLTIDVTAKTADLQTAFDRAAHLSEKSANQIQESFQRAGASLANLGVNVNFDSVVGQAKSVETALSGLGASINLEGFQALAASMDPAAVQPYLAVLGQLESELSVVAAKKREIASIKAFDEQAMDARRQVDYAPLFDQADAAEKQRAFLGDLVGKVSTLSQFGAELYDLQSAGLGAASSLAKLGEATGFLNKLNIDKLQQQAADLGAADLAAPMIASLRELQAEFASATAAEDKFSSNNAFEDKAAGAAKLVQSSEYVRAWEEELRKADEAEKELAATKAFEVKAADAAQLVRASEYVSFWETELRKADAAEKEFASAKAFDSQHQSASQLVRDAEYVGFWENALRKAEQAQKDLDASNLFEAQHQAAAKLVRDTEYVRMWEAELQKADAAEKQFATQNDFVASLKRQSDAIGKSRADLLELQAAELGVADKAAPFITKMREAEGTLGRVGKNAKLTQLALNQVPAQFTDIVTSLAAGQSPMLVLLQQGGQLKDLFGGIGPAVRALGVYVAGLVNPFTMAGAAVAGLAFAWHSGSKEAEAFRTAIVKSGGAAGVTAGQLEALAESVDAASNSTQGAVADSLAQLVATGQVAKEQLAGAAQAAADLDRIGAQSVEDTVKAFADLGKAPSEAVAKLNEQWRFLTAATYRQIKAAEDAGDAAKAAALAQDAFAKTGIERARELEDALGTVEQALLDIKDAAKGVWDGIKNIGREMPLAQQVAEAESRLAALKSTAQNAVYGTTRNAAQSQIAEQENSLALLKTRLAAETEVARNKKDQAAGDKAGIELAREADKYLSKELQMRREIARVTSLADEALKRPGLSESDRAAITKDRDQSVAGIREKFATKGSGVATSKDFLDQRLAALNDYIGSEKQLLSSREQFLSAYYSADELSIRAYFDARTAAQQEYLTKARQGYADEIAELEKFIKSAKPKDAVDAQTKLADVRQKLADVEREASEQTVKDWLDQRNAVQQYEDKLADLRAQILEFKGATGEAATIRFDISTRDIRKQLEAANDSAALNDLAVVRQRTIIESSLKNPQDAAAIIQDQLRNTEQRIHIDQDIGATSELDALQKLSAARQDAVGQLKAIADQWEAIIAGTDDPRLKQNLENFKAQIDQLAAASDLLSQRLQTVGESGLTAFLDEMTSGTHDLTKAFQNMGKVFQQEITRMVSQDLSRRIFGKGEGSLDVFGALKNLFGAPASDGATAPVMSNAAGTMSLASNVVSLIPRSMSVAPAASSTIAAAASNTAAEASAAASASAAMSGLTASTTAIDAAMTALGTTTVANDASFSSLNVVVPTSTQELIKLAAAASSAATAMSAISASSGAGAAGNLLGAGSAVEGIANAMSGDALDNWFELFALASAKGNAFAGAGPVRAFASGGAFGNGEILTSPTLFRFASGGSFRTGVAGEAGPEAALPLKRMSNGKLGVATDGGGQPIIINVHVPAGTAPQMRASAAQGAREAIGALNRAKRYG